MTLMPFRSLVITPSLYLKEFFQRSPAASVCPIEEACIVFPLFPIPVVRIENGASLTAARPLVVACLCSLFSLFYCLTIWVLK